MAILKCRHCQGEISSGSRSVQCPHCAALFPFECAQCGCNLRAPFAVYSDERYLSQKDEPLCNEHFLRLCPDCNEWFGAGENPGFFRCTSCTEKFTESRLAPWNTDNLENDEEWVEATNGDTTVVVTSAAMTRGNKQMSIPLLVALMNLFARFTKQPPTENRN